MTEHKPKLAAAKLAAALEQDDAISIAKPDAFDLDKFRSKHAAAMAGVVTLQAALPHYPISHAKDFVRLHPNEGSYWSSELCFVSVPVKGQQRDTLHLIEEDLAMQYLPSARIQRFRLVLAAKPYDVFFFCHVPTRNTDNTWVASNLQACEQAKTHWTQATSRRDENIEAYKIDVAQNADAFPEPNWPAQSLSELIGVTFTGRMIDRDDHPGLLRLIGARQSTA